MLNIDPFPKPSQGMTLEWKSCSGAALVELLENQAAYRVQSTGADCVRLIVRAGSGDILEDVFFGLTIQ
jgi:hypothetical protein